MHEVNRDLLVLGRSADWTDEEMGRQLRLLNTLLYSAETWECFCLANEVIDLNRRRVIRNPHHIRMTLSDRRQKPFVFVNNKN